MARISLNSNKKPPWYLRLFFYFQKKKYGHLSEPLELWQRTPKVFMGFLFMQMALNRKKSNLDPLLRGYVCTRVSQINHCPFCIDLNAYRLLQQGVAEDVLQKLSSFKEASTFTEQEVAALEYTEAITKSLNDDCEQAVTKLKKYFDEDQIVELTALISFQNLSSKFNAALDAQAFGFCKKDFS